MKVSLESFIGNSWRCQCATRAATSCAVADDCHELCCWCSPKNYGTLLHLWFLFYIYIYYIIIVYTLPPWIDLETIINSDKLYFLFLLFIIISLLFAVTLFITFVHLLFNIALHFHFQSAPIQIFVYLNTS